MLKIPSRLRDEFQRKHFGFTDCDVNRFFTLKCTTNPCWVLIYRLVVSLYTLAMFLADLLFNQDQFYLAYLTHWGEIIMVLYFFLSFFLVFLSFKNNCMSDLCDTNQQTINCYHVTIWILFNFYATVAFVVTMAYYIGVTFDLIDPVKATTGINFHVHAMNSILAVIELTLNNLLVRILHFYWPVLFGLIYVLVTLFLHFSGQISSIYDVLNWDTRPGVAVAIVAVLLLVVVPLIHVVFVWGFFMIREYVLHQVFAKLLKKKGDYTIPCEGRTPDTPAYSEECV